MESLFVDITNVEQLWDRPLQHAPLDERWNVAEQTEPRMHRIHGYPAKFPAFLTGRGLAYAAGYGIDVRRIGDIFCGCGTVAHEARREGLAFWGCDINPVATLIARAKSARLSPTKFARLAKQAEQLAPECSASVDLASAAVDRLRHWFSTEQFDDLARLLAAINTVAPESTAYRDALLCTFSAILKSCSQWRRRSNKPTLDPQKLPSSVLPAFCKQAAFLVSALTEQGQLPSSASQIHRASVLDVEPPKQKLDMLITSPPYVTSYEYADIHQLSSLWLGYASDHRDLREGSIGTTQHEFRLTRRLGELNRTATRLVFTLYERDKRSAQSIANYFIDMQQVALRARKFLADDGVAMFVIGNTNYRDIEIDNATHLTEALIESGFSRIRAVRRQISNKAATPYRNACGRFSVDRADKTIYSHEYVLMAHP